MRAAVFDAPRGEIVIRSLPAPDCPPDGVVVRVRATGVCRSDWHAWQGHDPVPLPHVPGHEFAGLVSAAGPEVSRWAAGDRVTAPFVLGCGTCPTCRAGDPQVCPRQAQPGFTYHGSFAEFVAVPAADFNLVALPAQIPFEAAAALGCRFATAFRALIAHGRVQRGESVVIFGCGGVGLSAVIIAVAAGARVIAIDVSAAALARARDLGAQDTVLVQDPSDPQPAVAQVRELTEDGADVTVDALGSAAAVRACIHSLRPRGRHVQVGLLFGADALGGVPLDRLVSQEIEVYGSHGIAAHDYAELFRFLDAHSVDLSGLIGHTVPLEQAGAALRQIGRSDSGPGITIIAIEA